jgi:outer membrane protein assembly factor BamB
MPWRYSAELESFVSEGFDTSQIAVRPPKQSDWIAIIRILAAWTLTVLGLPYVWARSFIGWQLIGRPEPAFALILLVVLAAIIALSYHVAAVSIRRRWVLPVSLVVATAWIAVNTVMFYSKVGTLIPRSIIIATYIPGSLLVPWTAWMFFVAWGWKKRLLVSGILLFLLVSFVALFHVDGLSGDSNINFSWRFGRSHKEVTGAGTAPRSAPVATGTLAGDPERDYPQFLGPFRTGSLNQNNLERDWKRNPPRELWRRPVGLGWSSFAVVGNYVFTQEQRGNQECVVCYSLNSGEELWLHADPVNFTSSLGGPGPRATPTVDQGRVYTIGATGILNCLNALDGQLFWTVNILKEENADNISHGVCASPLVLGNRVLVCPTGSNGPSLVAYDCTTGSRIWGGGRHAASYSSPVAAELSGLAQILLCNSAGLSSHDIESGEQLWHFDWTNSAQTNVAQPVVHAGSQDQVLVSTGYQKGCALIAVERSEGEGWSVHELWSNNRLKTKFCTAVMYHEHVFGLDDGILACLDLRTGDQTWKAGRYGHGQIIKVGDLLIVQAEEGDVVLGELDPRRWRELGRIKALSGKTWNNPALAGPYLLVRNDHEAACFELPLMQPSPNEWSAEADTGAATQ